MSTMVEYGRIERSGTVNTRLYENESPRQSRGDDHLRVLPSEEVPLLSSVLFTGRGETLTC